ncbi:hypothetical protein [Actinomadura rugatobispora]|uniref:Uncharacterized protein n=1 Tax=Actinomadura rugatobispora TaxID=1994 RepID=A0ABW0ZUL7_9ACTN|nr:hypothetical protein GCM10010200_097300 [Actinomadura rugatobispora]
MRLIIIFLMTAALTLSGLVGISAANAAPTSVGQRVSIEHHRDGDRNGHHGDRRFRDDRRFDRHHREFFRHDFFRHHHHHHGARIVIRIG